MKKIITTLCLLSISLIGFSQISLELYDDQGIDVSNGIHDVNLMVNTSVTTEIFVYNSDSVAHTYKCRRTVYTMDATDSTQFCWGGLCYNWGTNLSSMSLTINPGDTVDFAALGFHAIFKSKLATSTRTVHYNFYDQANTSDSTGVIIRYNFSTGINEPGTITGTISSAYPNPANSFVSMKYDIYDHAKDGRILIYDMLGKTVKEQLLIDKKGTTRINVEDLNAGVYFYSFLVDGKAIATKKLVINSK